MVQAKAKGTMSPGPSLLPWPEAQSYRSERLCPPGVDQQALSRQCRADGKRPREGFPERRLHGR